MGAEERQAQILRLIHDTGAVRSSDLVGQLGVSEVTIRRDLVELERTGRLHRVHGGAVAPDAYRRRGRVESIGVVLPSTRNYYPDVLRGIEAACAARGVRPVLAVSDYDPDVERSQLDRLIASGVSGILISTARGDDDPGRLSHVIGRTELPLVLVERSSDGVRLAEELPHVRTDHAYGARLAVRHLVGLGHRRIALAAMATSTSHWMQRGFAAELAESDLEPAFEARFPEHESRERPTLVALVERVRRHRVTAVVLHNDELALRLVDTATAMGVRVPDELSVIAYDDTYSRLAQVSLTAVSPPKRDIGSEAARLLFSAIDHDGVVAHVDLLPRLVVRHSCVSSDGRA